MYPERPPSFPPSKHGPSCPALSPSEAAPKRPLKLAKSYLEHLISLGLERIIVNDGKVAYEWAFGSDGEKLEQSRASVASEGPGDEQAAEQAALKFVDSRQIEDGDGKLLPKGYLREVFMEIFKQGWFSKSPRQAS